MLQRSLCPLALPPTKASGSHQNKCWLCKNRWLYENQWVGAAGPPKYSTPWLVWTPINFSMSFLLNFSIIFINPVSKNIIGARLCWWQTNCVPLIVLSCQLKVAHNHIQNNNKNRITYFSYSSLAQWSKSYIINIAYLLQKR